MGHVPEQSLRPRPFEYYAPTSLSEALDLVVSNQGAKILAGGQSLITLMKLRLAAPEVLIDINSLPELTHIREENGLIVLGALIRHDQLATSRLIREKCPLLTDAANAIGDQQVRNRGTIGGSLAHADPNADLPTACTALGATVVAASLKGSRSIKLTDFFTGYFTTSLRQDEIIKEVQIPLPTPSSGGAYVKLTRWNNDLAIVAVAAQLTVDSDDTCRAASVVLGGVAPIPYHATNAEAFLTGRRLDHKIIEEGAQQVSKGLEPPSDFRASVEYRVKMAVILTSRAIETAVGRARGSV
jgi:carbon-monoxide dehydrogenase medium subunit